MNAHTSPSRQPPLRRDDVRSVVPARLRLALAALASILVVGLTANVADAHSGVQSYVYIDVTDDGLGGRIEMPYSDMRDVLGLRLQGSDDEILGELRANEGLLAAYVRDHFSVGDDVADWDFDVTLISLLQAEEGYGIVHFLVDVPYPDVPRVLEVGFDPFFDEIDDRTALLLIGNDWKGGVIENGESVLLGFDPDTRTHTVDLGSTSQWNNFTASIGQGVDHIRSGPDHILFVAVLLLPSVLVFTSIWRPAASFGATLWRILKIVSMFTLAHSITFVLAGVDVIPLPPSRLVETIIAFSIAVTAVHNLHPVFPNREWLIAFVFGLFHGLGFAGFVQGLDLDRRTKLVSLLGRNVGIEIGQSVVVILLFSALFALRRTRWYRPLFLVGSAGLAVIATGWMVERLFVVDLRVSRFVDPALRLPRAVILVAVVTVVAVAVRALEERAGRLLPTVADDLVAAPDDRELVTTSISVSND